MSTLTINTFDIPNCQYTADVVLRVYYQSGFVASDGTLVMGGTVGSPNWFVEVTCTLDPDTAILTVPEFDLITTDNPLPANAVQSVASGIFYQGGTQLDTLFSQFIIPVSLAPTTDFSTLSVFNATAVLTYPSTSYPTTQQVLALIGGTTPGSHATTHEAGGADEIDVTGLSGVLVDPQPPDVEGVQDAVGAMVRDNDQLEWTFDSGVGTLTVAIKEDSLTAALIGPAEINIQTGTDYTLLASDNNKTVTLDNGSAISLTVPAGLGSGFRCDLIQLGAGQVTLVPDATTVNNRQTHTKIAGQFGVVSLVAYADDIFALSGDTGA